MSRKTAFLLAALALVVGFAFAFFVWPLMTGR